VNLEKCYLSRMKFMGLFLILSVVGCGIKSPTKELDAESSGSSSSLQNYPVCPDELRIAEIPSGWREVKASDLITGKRIHFQVQKVHMMLLTGLDGRPITVSTKTTFDDGKVKENKVDCQNLTEGEFLKFHIEVPLHISQRNGYLSRADRKEARLAKLSFDLKDGTANLTKDKIEKIEEPSERGLEADFPLTFMASTDKVVKFYLLPDGELEVRKGEVVKMNGLHAEFFTAIRYRVAD